MRLSHLPQHPTPPNPSPALLLRAPSPDASFWLLPARALSPLPLEPHPDTLVVAHAREPLAPKDPEALVAYGLLQPAFEHSAPGILEPFSWPERGAHPHLSALATLQQIRWGHIPLPSLRARLAQGFEVALVTEDTLWLAWDHRALGGRALQETKKPRAEEA